MPGQRRSYPKSFKAKVVDECTQPGASVGQSLPEMLRWGLRCLPKARSERLGKALCEVGLDSQLRGKRRP